MEFNKTYLYVGVGMLALAGLTGYLVFKAPKAAGSVESAEAEGLNKPRALAFAKNGDLLIVDSRNNRIEVRKPDGSLRQRFGHDGSGKGDFHEPCGIAVDKDGNVYVADTFYSLDPNHGLPWGRIQKFDDDYDFKSETLKSEAEPSDFFGPRAVGVDPQGRVWVSDTGHSRIVVYGKDGKFVAAFGQKGKKDLEFDEPFGLDFDAEGNAYIADRLNVRIQVVSKDFKFVRSFKVDGWDPSVQINQEPYVAVDKAKGRVYVSDPTKNKVHGYDLKGGDHKAYAQGLEGPTAAAFNLPTGLVVAADGSLLVSDGGSNRILTLKP